MIIMNGEWMKVISFLVSSQVPDFQVLGTPWEGPWNLSIRNSVQKYLPEWDDIVRESLKEARCSIMKSFHEWKGT